jgi:hypothetical protein
VEARTESPHPGKPSQSRAQETADAKRGWSARVTWLCLREIVWSGCEEIAKVSTAFGLTTSTASASSGVKPTLMK